MAEYIAREVLLAQLREMESYNVSPMYRRGYDDCVEAILKAPAADVVPVVHGGGLRKPFLKGVDILNALIVAHTKTDIQQLKVIIAGDAARRWTEA